METGVYVGSRGRHSLDINTFQFDNVDPGASFAVQYGAILGGPSVFAGGVRIAARYSGDITGLGARLASDISGAVPIGWGIPTIGGRKPINSAYAGRTHPSGVRFTMQGFPDFSPYAKANVEIRGLTGKYSIDAALANAEVGLRRTPDNFVWHHVEDGVTMQLIPKNIHATRHTGGSAVIKNGGFD